MWCVGGLARWWLAVAVAVAVAGAAEILEEGEELPYPSPLSLFPRLGRDDCTAPGGECLGRELCVATLAGNRCVDAMYMPCTEAEDCFQGDTATGCYLGPADNLADRGVCNGCAEDSDCAAVTGSVNQRCYVSTEDNAVYGVCVACTTDSDCPDAATSPLTPDTLVPHYCQLEGDILEDADFRTCLAAGAEGDSCRRNGECQSGSCQSRNTGRWFRRRRRNVCVAA